MTATNAPSAVVVGGGLSGIVLSHELALRGWVEKQAPNSGTTPGGTWISRVPAGHHCPYK